MSEMFLVGNAKAGTLATFRVEDERIARIALTHLGAGCGTFAIEGELVFCATKEPSPAILTLRLDRETGELAELSRVEIDDPVAYITTYKGGEYVLAASYHGGWGDMWPVGEDGRLGAPLGERVHHPNLHCVVVDDDQAWFVSLGADLVANADLSTGFLTERPGEALHVTKGSGPRHMVIAGDEAFIVTEFSGELFRLRREGHGFALTETTPIFAPDRQLAHSRYGAEPLDEHLIWGADVHVAGDFVLATERTESTLAAVRDGKVEALTQVQAQPRGFAVAPDGRHVVVAGEMSGGVSLHRLEDDGRLTELWAAESGEGANWVRFV